MKFSEVQLPSNKKFGFFFALIFTCSSLFFLFKDLINLSLTLIFLAISFALITIIKDELLLPLNKIWMGFGLVLGAIVSPIILGALFFLMFTPIGLILRIFGRDELLIKPSKKASYWRIKDDKEFKSEVFKHQF